MPRAVILALDQGSSSTRCVAYDSCLQAHHSAVRRVATRRPSPGMVEHDPGDLLAGALECVREVSEENGLQVGAIGIANQMESFVLWERDTGRPASPVVSWQDRRARELCAGIAERPEASAVPAKTGLTLDSAFCAPKLAWLFAADSSLQARAETGELLFGDVASWLAWHLSGGSAHVTEPSNACRSLLVDLETLRWDAELLALFGIPAALLPEIRSSDDLGVGSSSAAVGFEAPLAAMLGDQPAALYGQGCTSPRMGALTLGTGAFLWLNVGPHRPDPPPGVLATAAWDRRGKGPTYALEAFCANAGNALDVLPALGLPADSSGRAPDWSQSYPVIVAAPAGLGTPRWHDVDGVSVLGATSATTAVDLAVAGVVGIAHQIVDALESVDARNSADVLRVGGGLSAHRGLVQAVADLSGLTLEVAADPEATARGIATLAAEAVALLDDDVAPQAIARRVAPVLDEGGRTRERSRWDDAVQLHMRSWA